ncbi:hypothetical protein B0T17DRAFT_255784 [Bombardia bombarda]|uniref:Clr5 domain-containing protein n=1 Tax=Bombardia bombarda TaxID=252184 RepID=A0AA40C5C8_9PEZI|nr:hypothetical protein B0T17DRAFT_255784 [Bombardia bombarda]
MDTSLGSCVSVPKSQVHWESQKHTIKGLYLDENLPLPDVMAVMEKLYQFRASRKMYKHQFLKWQWKKYKSKALTSGDQRINPAQHPANRKTCMRSDKRRRFALANVVQSGSTTVSSAKGELRINRGLMDDELTMYKRQTIWNIEILSGEVVTQENLSEKILYGISADILGAINGALCLLYSGKLDTGRLKLGQAFRMMGKALKSTYDFLIFCVSIPAAIIFESADHGYRLQLFRIYLDYVIQLAHEILPGHPITSTVVGLRCMFLKAPGEIPDLIETLLNIVSDSFESKTEFSQETFRVYCQVINEITAFGMSLKKDQARRFIAWGDDLCQDLLEIPADWDEADMDLVYRLIIIQTSINDYATNFLPLALALLAVIRRREGGGKQLPGGIPSKSELHQYVCISVADYFNYILDPEQELFFSEAALLGPIGPYWFLMCGCLESRLRDLGRNYEANSWHRLKLQVESGEIDVSTVTLPNGDVRTFSCGYELPQGSMGAQRIILYREKELNQWLRYVNKLREEEQEEATILEGIQELEIEG